MVLNAENAALTPIKNFRRDISRRTSGGIGDF
jgi:hypothetical protein